MRAARALPNVDAVDAALRQLPPQAECLLRVRFRIGRAARRTGTAVHAVPKQRLQQLEACALRTLRLNATDPHRS